MRDAMRALVVGRHELPDHLGLAYGSWAPVEADGKIADESRAQWLAGVARCIISPDYAHAFRRWEASFAAPGDRTTRLALASRLLVGHGNPSAIDVGITLHHTWGVPIIPGSALKGLVAHYVDAVYGPDGDSAPSADRAPFRGVTWKEGRIWQGPGDVYRQLFGAPDADDDERAGPDAGATGGTVLFHDALYVPATAPDDQPFAVDVLTVHQKDYYNSGGETWPNDHDSPNPVGFITVRPRVQLLVALSGPADWTALAERLLLEALRAWGVGGKTSSGYGRLVPPHELAEIREGMERGPARPAPGSSTPARLASTGSRRRERGERVTVTRVEGMTRQGKPKFHLDGGVLGLFNGTAPEVDIGATVEAWIASANGDTYALALQPSTGKAPKPGKR